MSMKITVERLLEQEVDEISRNGEEKHIKPFSVSEQLTHFASRIDFYEGIDKVQTEEEKNEKTSKDSDNNNDTKEENRWHWEGVYSKLKLGLSETCVMLDVLQNLNKKKYLVLDPIQQSAAPEKQTIQMFEKRKYLARAGSIIGKGAMAIQQKQDESEPIVVEDNENEYYMQLMKLRQYWRVKKSGTQITGDVSYRSAGSKFWHPGLFEVKADNNRSEEKTISVNVSPDLTIPSQIKVTVCDQSIFCQWKETSNFIFKPKQPDDWEYQLKMAQTHLFNKELFANLSNDAFQGSFSRVEVLDYQISCQILDDAHVIISHETGLPSIDKNTEFIASNSKNGLNFLLKSLLLKQYKLISKRHTPYPSTSNSFHKQSCSSTVFNLLNRNKLPKMQSSILHNFIIEAKLIIWEKRLKFYFENQNLHVNGPYIVTHWNTANIKDHVMSLIVSIISKLDSMIITRTSCFISISGSGNLTMIFDDTRKIELACDIDSLDKLMRCKLQCHMVNTVKALTLLYGWSIINCTSLNFIIPSVDVTGFTECRMTIKHLKTQCSIYLNLSQINDIKAHVSTDELPNFVNPEFAFVSTACRSINWDLLMGHSFAAKLQTLLLCV